MPPIRPRPRPMLAAAAVIALGVATAAAPALIGGAPGWSVPIIATLAACAALVATAAAWRAGRPLPIGLCFIVLVGTTLWTALQAVPLPCGLAEWLAPDAVEHARRTAELVRQDLRCTITQDPGRTREEALKGLTLVSFFIAATLTAAVTRRDRVLRIVAGTCVAVGASVVVHSALDASQIWGLYTPLHGTASYGPFVNPNHAGGVLAMGAPVAMGLAFAGREEAARTRWALATVFLLACTALTGSRGATLAAVGGVALFAALQARSQARGTRAELRTWWSRLLVKPQTVFVLVALGAVALVTVVAGLEAVQREIEIADVSKAELALRALELAATGPWLGVGRGAFPVAFVERSHTTHVRFDYAENSIAQWSVDWGLPVGIAVTLALGLALVRALRDVKRPHMFGAVAGVCAYAAQNLVDFGFEMLGSASIGVVLLAAATGESHSSGAPSSTRNSLALAASGALLTLAATALLGRGIHEHRVEVAQALLERALSTNDRDAFARTLPVAMLAHPQEPVLPLLAGAEAARHDESRALTYLSRAMALAPGWPSPHIVAGRFLATHDHPDQALIEMRAALERATYLAHGPACEVLRLRPSAAALLRMTPTGPARSEALGHLVQCVQGDMPGVEEIDTALLATEPQLEVPRVRLARRALQRGDLDAAARWLDTSGESPALLLARADLDVARGRDEAALEHVTRAEALSVDPWDAVVARARIQASLQRWDDVRGTVGELRGLSGADPNRLGTADVLLGDLERNGGHSGRALAAYEDAWRSFERLDALERVAAIASELGDEERARAARSALCARERTAYCTAP